MQNENRVEYEAEDVQNMNQQQQPQNVEINVKENNRRIQQREGPKPVKDEWADDDDINVGLG